MNGRGGGEGEGESDGDDRSDLSAHVSLISQRQVLGGLRHTGDTAVKAAQVTPKVLGGDAREI